MAECPVCTICLRLGNFARLSSWPAYIVLSSGIIFYRKVNLVAPSSASVSGEKIRPLALEVAKVWSKASALSFSSKVTMETPALIAPIWVTRLSVE